jgi:secreted trypsin-like serine protease
MSATNGKQFTPVAMLTLILACATFAVGHAQTCQPRSRVVGGVQARAADWPGFASLRAYSEQSNAANYICGGAAIAENYVVTAAHCVAALKQQSAVGVVLRDGATQAGRLEVVLGAADLTTVTDDQIFRVAEVTVHETYRAAFERAMNLPPSEQQAAVDAIPATVGHDIALLRLSRPYFGQVARLALSEASIPKPGAQVRVAGFGRRDSISRPSWLKTRDGKSDLSAGSSILVEAAVPLVPQAACARRYADSAIGTGQLCAGFDVGGVDSCQGDSGGPLVAYDAEGCPYQIGLVSWGEECAKPAAYGVYTRLSAFRDWMEQQVGPLNSVAPIKANTADDLPVAALSETLSQLKALLGSTTDRLTLSIRGGHLIPLGRDVVFEARSKIAGRLIIIDVNAARELTLIFPNQFTRTQGLVAAGQSIEVPNAEHGFSAFRASEPVGKSWLIAFVAPESFDVEVLAASPEIRARGFVPIQQPTGYMMSFVRQIDTAVRAAGATEGWALAVLEYEITR